MGQILAGLAGLVSIVCWIMTLIAMFQDKQDGGTLKGVLGIICALWAFIWGWMHAGRLGRKNVMIAWTIAIILGGIGNVMAIGAAAGGGG